MGLGDLSMLGVVDLAEAFGIAGALAAMVIAATTPFPAEIAALAIAMKHGFWLGLALIWTGSMIGALLSYALAFWICRHAGWIARTRAVRMARLRMTDLGWFGIFGLRLIPFVPFFALSLAAGLIRAPLPGYVAGTALGMLPASTIVALLGQGVISGRAGLVVTTIIALVALPAMAWLLTRRRDALPGRTGAGWETQPLARGEP